MYVASDQQLLAGSQHHFRERIGVVHRIEKWEARILARRRQNRKKCPVRPVIRVLVATRVVVPAADPRPKLLGDIRLPSAFRRERSGALRQIAPTPALQYPPSKEIERSGTRRRREDDVSTVRPDVDAVVDVGGFRGRRAIVGLQNRSIIVIKNSEDAPLGIRRAETRMLAQCDVRDWSFNPA